MAEVTAEIESILADLRRKGKEITTTDLQARMDRKDNFLLIDVREAEENRRGFIPGSSHLSRGFLELQIGQLAPDKDRKIVLYCAGGKRSLLALRALNDLGYTNVESLQDGFQKWQSEDRAVKNPAQLDEQDLRRYARHLAIPEVGVAGQKKLLSSRVLIIGAGGLGCPSAYYLAAAGVGTIGIVDFDRVEESNLQRQILHTPDRIGELKTDSAERTLKNFNPRINIVKFSERLTTFNAENIFKDFDLVLDGSDNFTTRYLINDTCVKLGKPFVHGSVYRFEGQVSIFTPDGPCYRCVFPSAPPPELAPSCAEAGVLGVLPGLIGILEATEAIKYLLEIGTPLTARLLTFDALEMNIRDFKIERNPNCQICSNQGSHKRPTPG